MSTINQIIDIILPALSILTTYMGHSIMAIYTDDNTRLSIILGYVQVAFIL